MSAAPPVLTEENPYTRLGVKGRRYVDARLQGLGPVAAKKAAGIRDNGSYEQRPTIRAAIKYVVQQGCKRASDLSKSDVMQGMLDAVDAAETSQELVSAWREIGKLIGAYEPERRVLEIRDYTKEELKSLSDEQLAELAGREMKDVIDGEFYELATSETSDGEGRSPGSDEAEI